MDREVNPEVDLEVDLREVDLCEVVLPPEV